MAAARRLACGGRLRFQSELSLLDGEPVSMRTGLPPHPLTTGLAGASSLQNHGPLTSSGDTQRDSEMEARGQAVPSHD